MNIQEIIDVLEAYAPPSLQEEFDNSGLLVGDAGRACTGVLCTLDATEAVIGEAVEKGCNLVVTYHPIVFRGLKRITGKSYVERAVISAIRKEVAIYAIHTNLDSVAGGVNGKIASLLSLSDLQPLEEKAGLLRKLFVFVPRTHAKGVRQALFSAGAGHIGRYSDCSFNGEGTGTYRAGEGTHPFAGRIGERHEEPEVKVEVIFPLYRQDAVIKAMKAAHPYEEIAFDLVSLENTHPQIGSGWIGTLPSPLEEGVFLSQLKNIFNLTVIRHSPLLSRPVSRVALCGGAGSFLTAKALGAGADWLVTADIKYHEFFAAEDRIVLADIGHFESEQFTVNLLHDILRGKFSTFAVLYSKTRTNPVHYFI
jgi:dinuclear metal center YbgI/SA1388 family protein